MRLLLSLLPLFTMTIVNAQNVVNVSDYGVIPESHVNVVPALKEAIKA